jgi:mono/diheme cytochrome c family protein
VTPRFAGTALTVVLVAAAASQQVSRVVASATSDDAPLPARLTETGLYGSDRPEAIAPGVRQFLPQYPLWSDGLKKRRWISLPAGSSIDATSELAWDFPVGTKFWKEFSLNGRRIETRMLWKTSATGWKAASYVWNDDETEAVLAPAEGIPVVAEIVPGKRYSVPSRTDCLACHGMARTGPLGFNALQLSTDRDPNAIHGEPLAPGMITLADLVNERRLSPAANHLVSDPPHIRTADASTRSVLGYLAANCATCHNRNADGVEAGPSLTLQDLLRDGDAAAQSLIGRPSSWQVPGVPDGRSVVLHSGSPDLSALFVRMRSRSPSSQMPPLGTVIRDQQALDAISRWISNLEEKTTAAHVVGQTGRR